MGVAVMVSLIQSRYHDGLTSNVPAAALEQPQIRQALNDPQFPLNPEASQRVQQAFLAFGDQGQTLFAQTIEGVRASLATAITDAFLIAVFILIVAVIVSLFMKEIPLRKAHYDAEEAAEIAALSGPGPAPAGVVAAIPPIAGGANGNPLSGGGDQPTLSP
jgi:hypothetical protein